MASHNDLNWSVAKKKALGLVYGVKKFLISPWWLCDGFFTDDSPGESPVVMAHQWWASQVPIWIHDVNRSTGHDLWEESHFPRTCFVWQVCDLCCWCPICRTGCEFGRILMQSEPKDCTFLQLLQPIRYQPDTIRQGSDCAGRHQAWASLETTQLNAQAVRKAVLTQKYDHRLSAAEKQINKIFIFFGQKC